MPTMFNKNVGVTSGYTINGNPGRKLVMLDDKSLVTVVYSGGTFYTYRSTDNGATWKSFTGNSVIGSIFDISIDTDGKNVFAFLTNGTSLNLKVYNSSGTMIDSLTNDYGGMTFGNYSAVEMSSMIINKKTKEIHAVWSATSQSDYSYNLFYVKGAIGADGKVILGIPEKITSMSNSSYRNAFIKPSITLYNDVPIITATSQMSFTSSGFNYEGGNTNTIVVLKKDKSLSSTSGNAWLLNSNWSATTINKEAGYTQGQSQVIYVPQSVNQYPNGRIYVAWHGNDSSNTTNTVIKMSYSDDGGYSWSNAFTVSSNNTKPNSNVSITANAKDEVWFYWNYEYSTSDIDLRARRFNANTWDAQTSIAISGNKEANPQLLFDIDYKVNFTKPLFVSQLDSTIVFGGTWKDVTIEVMNLVNDNVSDVNNKNSVITYKLTSVDGGSLNVLERINGTQVKSRSVTNNTWNSVSLTDAQWDAIKYGKYTESGASNHIEIEHDGQVWRYTFGKMVNESGNLSDVVKASIDLQYHFSGIAKDISEAVETKGVSVAQPKDSFSNIKKAIEQISTGKKIAQGTTSVSSGNKMFNYYFVSSGSYPQMYAGNYPYIEVTGLSFKPSAIMVYSSVQGDDPVFYNENGLTLIQNNTITVKASSRIYGYTDGYDLSVTNGGFCLPLMSFNSASIVKWIAYE
jgi:hypothetical protein